MTAFSARTGVCAVFVRDREHIAAMLPEHCRTQVARLLHDYAQVYQDFADQLAASDSRDVA